MYKYHDNYNKSNAKNNATEFELFERCNKSHFPNIDNNTYYDN